MNGLGKATIRVGLILVAVLAAAQGVSAATGDYVATVNFSEDCGTGVGIAFDGTNLWYSCYGTGVNLFRADPISGNVSASYSVPGFGLGALAYNASGNSIWAGAAGGDIYLIQLNSTKDVVNISLAFNTNPHLNWAILDGLAYDDLDKSLYLSPDGSRIIHHYATDGTHLMDGPNGDGDFLWAANASYNATYYNSGLAIGGNLLYEGSDGGSHVWVVNKTDPLAEVFNFSTIIAGDPNFRDEDLECDTNTFAPLGKQVMWSKEAYSPMRAHAFEIPAGSCGVGGAPPTPEATGNVTGGGWIKSPTMPAPKDNRATFGFVAHYADGETTPSGNLQYIDHVNGMNVHGNVTTLSVNKTAMTATFTGTATIDGSGEYAYTVTVADNGEPGKTDTFSISIPDISYTAAGTLNSGNIQVHDP